LSKIKLFRRKLRQVNIEDKQNAETNTREICIIPRIAEERGLVRPTECSDLKIAK